jgi:hypothetical protein
MIFHAFGAPAITFIPCEEHFRLVLPTIEGNVDYLALRGQLTTMGELLRSSVAVRNSRYVVAVGRVLISNSLAKRWRAL